MINTLLSRIRSLVQTTSARTLKGERGQLLPTAMGALALGIILITPLLSGASGGSQATALTGRRALERYSMDAAVEWSGWRLMADPLLTADTSFTATPLQPFPPSVNGMAFPQTEIRYVAGAGAVVAGAPSWQSGGGDKCYPIQIAEDGTLSARISVDAGQVWAVVLAGTDPCSLPGGTSSLGSAPEVGADFAVSAGSYQLLVRTDSATTGAVALSVPAATYEVRSLIGDRNVVARIVASYSGVRIDSWQLN